MSVLLRRGFAVEAQIKVKSEDQLIADPGRVAAGQFDDRETPCGKILVGIAGSLTAAEL